MSKKAPRDNILIKAIDRFSLEGVARVVGVVPKTVQRWVSGESNPKQLYVDVMERMLHGEPIRKTTSKACFTFIDLFAGIGGIRLGFEGLGGKCVFTSEWNKFSNQTYRANFCDDHEIVGDITKIEASDIPDHDVLLAGFPCQPFSIAGVSKKISLGRAHGFLDETQGTLFFDVARIIKEKKPKAFLLENVKNLQSHDKGHTFQIIKNTLEQDLGYHIHWKVIDGQHFVPQHRERIIIVGFRDDVPFSWDSVVLPPKEHAPRIGAILHPEDGSESGEEPYTDKYGKIQSKYVLTDGLWDYLQMYSIKHKMKGNGFGFGMVDKNSISRTLSARYHKDGSEILVSRGKGKNPRRLTPRECARLMGFDSKERKIVIPVSDTQAYRQFGNAVVVPVIEAVAKAMSPFII